MKRFIRSRPIAAVMAVAFVAAACGSEDSSEPTDDAEAAPEEVDEDFDPETYFEGKTIRFVTSSGAGGGTDTLVRTIASQLPRFIPGNPATQVSNVTPHVAGINFMWEADPDGLTVGVTSAPTLEFEFFEGATWNSAEFEYVGSIDAECGNMLLARGDLGYSSIDDLIGSDGPTLVTMTSAPSPADFEPVQLSTMLIADYLDIPLEVKRVAESGTSALNLALERGEINFARYGNSWCLIPSSNPGWLEDGFVVPILDVGVSGPGAMAEGVEERGERPPHVSDVLTPEQFDEWTGLVAASRAGGNPMILPPGTPEEIRDVLRDAWEAAFADEDFVEVISVAFGGSGLEPMSGDEATELFTNNLEVMTRFQEEAEAITEEMYEKYVN